MEDWQETLIKGLAVIGVASIVRDTYVTQQNNRQARFDKDVEREVNKRVRMNYKEQKKQQKRHSR